MEFHEIANIFPMMLGDDYRKLKDDIAKNGQLEPIIIHEGKILDGRNRYTACKDLGVDVKYENYEGNNPLQFVVSKNLRRRHLDTSQRALVAARMANMPLGGSVYRFANLQTENLVSQSEAAEMLNVSPRIVASVKSIENNNPEFIPYIESGIMTVNEAEKGIKKQERADMHASKRTQAFISGKYRIIYADPPWKYGNSGVGIDNYGPAERHYPSLSIDELCQLPVNELIEDDSVLFMWVTSPLLEECFPVIKAWGFKYKTSFVWDKVKHNFGHYNSVRHELLLVCVRGSCTPDVNQLFDSVITEERTEHSRKPETFRKIIDTIYPNGKRIELFARSKAEGWEIWGNEPEIN